MEIMDYIVEEALVLIPVLVISGMILKRTKHLEDRYIPTALLGVSIGLAVFLVEPVINAIIQGILVTGAAVLGNQMVKQLKDE
ncbi:phage holin family protein [Alkalibacillus salilacus]|uniref:Prepilin signal peptidase PulO-like enzyme (Type II secretory pathway) n=1 Tax=Alkalibacillus salilacus TaxID=284582 RepID=A0ABT9VCY6_9BACI|nr:phage holin family protein [Alkalibacillus salilacus]MDQ0158792.1 prepilin signal peptidase PulO-like enzyme (type II secretory pathway) [Alkalibacillus salilacus]